MERSFPQKFSSGYSRGVPESEPRIIKKGDIKDHSSLFFTLRLVTAVPGALRAFHRQKDPLGCFYYCFG